MKTSWRIELPMIALLGVMFLLAAWTWPHAPDRIPTRWDLDGEVSGWGGRFQGLLLPPLLALGVYLLMLLLPWIDPGRANYPTFARVYTVIRVAAVVVMAVVYGITHLVIREVPVRVATVMPILIGALFVVLGGVMGKIRPNWFVGIRTPWTLSSKTAWVRTHRLGGFLFLATGVATLAALVVSPRWAAAALLGGTLVTVGVSFVYSYRVWRDDPDKVPPAGSLPAEATDLNERG